MVSVLANVQKHTTNVTITTNEELKNARDNCVSDMYYLKEILQKYFKLINDEERSDDYYDERFFSWDGFRCHNSVPYKLAQQTRCEDLGYEWYEGTALDVMNHGNRENTVGIPIDLSGRTIVKRKNDGKPVEGDMEGVCIYPNVDAGFISQPANFIINPDFIGEQVIMIKWREYGTGWWEDLSCCRKLKNLSFDVINQKFFNTDNSNRTWLLGENVALIPFKIEQTSHLDTIKTSINNALQNYEYFVYNGEWVVWAKDIIESIDRSMILV